jgi:serine/threonine protein kinase
VELADFGLSIEGSSQNLPTKYSSGTPGYRAPELMDSNGDPALYNNKVDIWAMGSILYELAIGIRPFQSDWEVLNHRFSGKNINVVLDSFDTHSVEIITKYIVDMLKVDPADRPSASFLSNGFNGQLQLAQHSVLLRVTDSVTLEAKSESRKDDEDEYVLESQKQTPLDLAEESPAEVYSTKLFR